MKQIFLLLLSLLLTSLVFAQDVIKLNVPGELLIADMKQSYTCPEWSPDGRKLAFTSFKYAGIWTSLVDGSDIKMITDEAAAGFGFSWSPDSRTILARVAKFENKRRLNALKLYNLSTATAEQLTEYKTESMGLPQWTGKSGEITFMDGKNLQQITTGLNIITTDKFVFTEMDRILIREAQAKENVKLNPIPGAEYLDLQLSPDESKLAFQQVGGNLYVLYIQENKLIDIGSGHRPRWSPDSRFISYMVTKDDGYNFTVSEIMISTADGQTKYQVTDSKDLMEMNPSWSPDGKKIAFDADGDIYIINKVDEIIR